MAFAVVTVAVTAGSIAVFGEAITDPVEIVARIDNVWVTVIGAITFVIATIGINVVANFVSASYDLANVAPKYIDFRRGGLISAIAAVVITPWHLYSSPDAIFYFLGGLGALLGPLFGVIFTDYYLVRRQQGDDRGAVPGRPTQPLLLPARLEPEGTHRRWCGSGVLAVRRVLHAVAGLVGVLVVRRRGDRRADLLLHLCARRPADRSWTAVRPSRRPGMTDLDLMIRAPAWSARRVR